jgi:hypothetical protein
MNEKTPAIPLSVVTAGRLQRLPGGPAASLCAPRADPLAGCNDKFLSGPLRQVWKNAFDCERRLIVGARREWGGFVADG